MTTTYKRWADNERLYAADLNNLADQAVPYFANTAGRNGAIASPVTGQLCYQADVALVLVYQGGRWVSANEYVTTMLHNNSLPPWAATTTGGARGPIPVSLGTNIWLDQHHTRAFVASGGTALSGSHKWVGVLSKADSGAGLTTLSTATIDSGSSGIWRTISTTIGALLGTTFFEFETTWTKTGTPGTLIPLEYITYRIVV